MTQSAGLLISQLWEESLQQAQKITENKNQAIHVQLASTEQAYLLTLEQSQELQNALLTAQQQLQKQDEKIDELHMQLQQLHIQKAALEQQVEALQQQRQE